MVLGILSWSWYRFVGIGMVLMCMWKRLSCRCYFNSYATSIFTKSFFFLTPWGSTLDSQLLCCDLIAEMHNTNTVITDIGIGLFSMPRFNSIMSVTVLHSYVTTGWSLKCLCGFECYSTPSEVCVGMSTCNILTKKAITADRVIVFFSPRS